MAPVLISRVLKVAALAVIVVGDARPARLSQRIPVPVSVDDGAVWLIVEVEVAVLAVVTGLAALMPL